MKIAPPLSWVLGMGAPFLVLGKLLVGWGVGLSVSRVTLSLPVSAHSTLSTLATTHSIPSSLGTLKVTASSPYPETPSCPGKQTRPPLKPH